VAWVGTTVAGRRFRHGADGRRRLLHRERAGPRRRIRLRSNRQPDRLREPAAGHPRHGLGHRRRRRLDDPGLFDGYQRQRRICRQFQDQDRCQCVYDRRLPVGLVPGRRGTSRRECDPLGLASADAARLCDGSVHSSRRLWNVGGLRVVGGSQHRSLRGLHRRSQANRYRRHEPDLLHRPQRCKRLQHRVSDLGRNLGGVQHIRRLGFLHRYRSALELAGARVQDQLQPALRDQG
jgi:hypothetical protein